MSGSGPIRVAGAMSGTSLDGVDVAEIVTDGNTVFEFGKTAYRAYSEKEREVLRAALGAWPGDPGVSEAGALVDTAHADLLRGFEAVQLIGYHGQTLAHDPRGRGTHQAGDGARLAQVLQTPVVWDFRSADVQLGGEGAPLAPFFHFACAKWIGATEPLVMLNLGGVANLTWIDPTAEAPEAPDAILAFDTGPANAPLNDLMRERRGVAMDKGGALAAAGTVDETRVARFLAHPFFLKIPPKSLDRGSFDFAPVVAGLRDEDAAATLVAVLVASVARGLEHCPRPPAQVLVTGGGRRNPVVMQKLAEALACPVRPVEDVGLNGDMLEAQAFAHLAVRVLRGVPTSCPATTGVAAAVGGGEISRPV